MKLVVVFAFPVVLVLQAIPRAMEGSNSTIYCFGTTPPVDGAVPKGSLIYVNGLIFGRTTTVPSTNTATA
jgi:hypothetical protein